MLILCLVAEKTLLRREFVSLDFVFDPFEPNLTIGLVE